MPAEEKSGSFLARQWAAVQRRPVASIGGAFFIGVVVGSLVFSAGPRARVADLESALAGSRGDLNELRSGSGVLEDQVLQLQDENSTLRQDNDDLLQENSELRQQNERLLSQPVPSFIGDPLPSVRAAASELGWLIEVNRRESSQPAGTVLRQSPGVGERLADGETVTVTVAEPPPPPPSSGGGSGGGGGGSGGGGGRGGGGGDCTPGYSPCLPPASDYDCAGGSGDGPEYTGQVTVTGSDPYGLDSDGDGIGCE